MDSDEEYNPDDDEVFYPTCSKQETPTPCIIHCTDSTERLLTLEKEETWKVLLKAAQIHQFNSVLKYSESPQLPNLHYHRKCYQKFTMKCLLERIENERKKKEGELQALLEETNVYDSEENKPVRKSSSTSTALFPNKCLFCDKETKYIKRKREKLRQCCEKRVQDTIEKAAMEKEDFEMISLLSITDFIASEVKYHHSCYSNYTRIKSMAAKSSVDVCNPHAAYKQLELQAYHLVVKYCHDIVHRPRIVKLQTIVSIMEDYLRKHDEDISISTKKHLRRNLVKTFKDELKFLVVRERVYLYPKTLTLEETIKDLIEERSGGEKDEIHLARAAACIRSEVKGMKDEMPWPPQTEDLQPHKFKIPHKLGLLLTAIFTGNTDETDLSGRNARLRLSLAQDIVYNLTDGKVKTPKSVLLPSVIKTLTNNTELINIMNRLGHGVSYSILSEMHTENAYKIQELQLDNHVVLPLGSKKEEFTIYVADNIDRREETLSGYGTTHKVNNLILQGGFNEWTQQSVANSPKRKRCRRSFVASSSEGEDPYRYRKRVGPSPINFPKNYARDLILDESNKRHFLWALMRFHDIEKSIPSWTGFQILISNETPIPKTTVGYLDCIDSPASDMSTIYQVMNRAVKIMESLKLVSIVCVFDQAIYSKAVEIKWKEKERFKNCVLMMGLFHMLMMYMHILSKRFADAGLRDALIQSNVIAEGSVDKALCGKMYNRGVRVYKLMYEAITIRVLEHMKIGIDEANADDVSHITSLDINALDVDSVWTDEKLISVYNDFIETRMKMGSQEGCFLQQFWISFLEMVEVLLNTIFSIRSGNWDLLLECIRSILPYAFAYDNLNYARYLTGMLGDMLQLPNDFPEVHDEFTRGNFAAQLSGNGRFSRTETDKVIEMTINKDSKTAGGCTGFSTNVNTVKRWEINAAYRAALRNCFHHHLNYQLPKYQHPDLNPTRVRKDQGDVQRILSTIAETFIDPLSKQPLISISTGVIASEKVTLDTKNAKELGETAMENFITTRLTEPKTACFFDPIKKMKLGTFATMGKIKTCKVNTKMIPLQASKDLFAKISLVAQIRSLDMRSVFKYPLGPLPWSLAEPIGTLKKTSKASLLHKLEGKIDPIESLNGKFALVVDGMAFVQQIKVANTTFGEFAMKLLERILSVGKVASRVDVVFDEYRNMSIKNVERHRRSRGQISFKKIVASAEIKQFGSFLSSNDNKNALIKFVVDQWKKHNYSSKIGTDKEFFVTEEQTVYKIGGGTVAEEIDLRSDHEEADTRMILHVQHAASSYDKVLVASPDTDVFIILLALHTVIASNIYFLTGVRNARRIIDVTKVADQLVLSFNPCEVSKELLMKSIIGIHSFTGCDTVSAFAARGKVKPLNLMVKDINYIEAFAELGAHYDTSSSLMENLEKFVCHMYGGKGSDVNEMRYRLYCQSGGKIECQYLPPCKDVLELHTKRANYQASIWRKSLIQYQNNPDPQQHGWVVDVNGDLDIKWMNCNPAPDEILELMSCSCKRRCNEDCPCVSHSLQCTDMCAFGDCQNMPEILVEEDFEEEYDSLSEEEDN